MQRQSPHGAWVSLLGDSARQDMHDSNAALHPPEVRVTRALSRVGMSGNMRFLTARTGMTATRTRGHRLRAIGCGPSVAGQTIVRRRKVLLQLRRNVAAMSLSSSGGSSSSTTTTWPSLRNGSGGGECAGRLPFPVGPRSSSAPECNCSTL
jgi:hypothetical protein